jgi:hypothetical protein
MWRLVTWPISASGECEHVSRNSWRATGDARVARTTYPTTRENSLAARSGELQLERGLDGADWLAFETWHRAGELLAQGAESPVIS